VYTQHPVFREGHESRRQLVDAGLTRQHVVKLHDMWIIMPF